MDNDNINDASRVKMALIVAAAWGSVWAIFLEFSRTGRWLVNRRTWITVVIGTGIVVLISRLIIPTSYVIRFLLLLASAGLPIVFRSIVNELTETNAISDALNQK